MGPIVNSYQVTVYRRRWAPDIEEGVGPAWKIVLGDLCMDSA